jgi:hypothetical protein
MAGKKFSETKVGQFLLNKIPNVVGSLAGNTPVVSAIKAIIGGSDMTDADKELALKKLELEKEEMQSVTQRWVADASSSSWLAQNVRPLTLAFLTLSFVAGWAYGLDELEVVTELLKIVFLAYFGGRSGEKVFGNKMHK